MLSYERDATLIAFLLCKRIKEFKKINKSWPNIISFSFPFCKQTKLQVINEISLFIYYQTHTIYIPYLKYDLGKKTHSIFWQPYLLELARDGSLLPN